MFKLIIKMKYKSIPINDIVLHKHPLVFLQLLLAVISDLFVWLLGFIVNRFLILLSVGIVAALIITVEFLHVQLYLST